MATAEVRESFDSGSMYICMYVCMYIRLSLSLSLYIYIYIHIYNSVLRTSCFEHAAQTKLGKHTQAFSLIITILLLLLLLLMIIIMVIIIMIMLMIMTMIMIVLTCSHARFHESRFRTKKAQHRIQVL